MSEMRRAEAPNKRIIIAGGGTIGKGLAKGAEKRFSVKIIEQSKQTALELSEQLDHAIALAKEYEHGFRHTAIIHSRNVRNMTKMGRELDTTLYVKNGPCMAALGLGGEGYLSFSIAGPTGEGVTTPNTFTRERRCSMIDELRVV